MLKTYELRVNYHIVDVKVSQVPLRAWMAARLENTYVYSNTQPQPGILYKTDRIQMEAGPGCEVDEYML